MSAPAEFTYFPRLPTELRLQIWNEVPQPKRVFRLMLHTQSYNRKKDEWTNIADWTTHPKKYAIPPLLHTSSESRSLFIERYKRLPKAVCAGPRLRINFRTPFVDYNTDVFILSSLPLIDKHTWVSPYLTRGQRADSSAWALHSSLSPQDFIMIMKYPLRCPRFIPLERFRENQVGYLSAAGHIASHLVSIIGLHREDREDFGTQMYSILAGLEWNEMRHVALPAFADGVTFADNEWVQLRYIHRIPSLKTVSFLVHRSRPGGWPAGMAWDSEVEDFDFEEGPLPDHFSGDSQGNTMNKEDLSWLSMHGELAVDSDGFIVNETFRTW